MSRAIIAVSFVLLVACKNGNEDNATSDAAVTCVRNDECDTPPAAVCMTATTLRTYEVTGTCSGSGCEYPYTDTACPSSCENGACVGGCPVGTVLIPAGPFVMGSDSAEGYVEEEPEHIVTVSSYCMDVTEVTNAMWEACVSAGQCAAPANTSSGSRAPYYGNSTYDSYPVIYVNWSQAQAYCMWAGKRLPTEAEWEKAARGGCEKVAPSTCGPEDERTYPWGEAVPTCSLSNFNTGTCVGNTDAVGARSPAGDGPYGTQDMLGNVGEWVADWYSDTYYASSPSTDPSGPTTSATYRVVRGGSWYQAEMYQRVARRTYTNPGTLYDFIGVRCAKTL
jgi:serine/threonine-protein kinase